MINERDIDSKYKWIHIEYSKYCEKDIEALKRGLFLLWYSITEPSCFTGIRELDSKAEERIVESLNDRLKNGNVDYELEWMFDYYSIWDYVFHRFSNYNYLQKRLNTESKMEMPDKIDREKMSYRGQMGDYWNSLTMYNE